MGTSVQLACKTQSNEEGITLFLSHLHSEVGSAVCTVMCIVGFCSVLWLSAGLPHRSPVWQNDACPLINTLSGCEYYI